MALEPKMVTAGTDDEGNVELRDMTKRFWIGAALALPVLPVWLQKDFGPWTLYGGGYGINPGKGNRDWMFFDAVAEIPCGANFP